MLGSNRNVRLRVLSSFPRSLDAHWWYPQSVIMDPETARHENSQKQAEDHTTKQGSPQTPALKDKLASETHLRRFTENVLDSRQQEIENRESEKGQLAVEAETLRRQLAVTQRQLAEAQDQIFRLQPRRRDITEAEAREAYKILVGNVQRWVENRAAYAIEDLEIGRLAARASSPEGLRLVSLLREQSRRCLSVTQSDEFHITGVIMNYLHVTLFSKSFYCPLDDTEGDGTSRWVDDLENTMSRLPREPAADLAHQLHLAPSVYSLKWPARTAATRLEVYQCLNLANGGAILDLSGTKAASQARRGVIYLFDIAPGLFVERVEGGRKLGLKAIVKPTVLVTNSGGDVLQGPTIMSFLWNNTPTSQGTSRSTSRASSSRRPAGSVISASSRQRY
ncbi:hypothetical protein FOXB_06850 [Fusarium oxysporum f. sp. conglutinans Fo5176]|uniref:Uncharacterized protein n=1 Tax=Fusarium oxysporum (strain Fo5176) TaxID=660025 RepID=F9FKC1_FUSOF|nr:hypothetical protein FOXB_06850 [Fusarium oxysporum f. sp. conglutinans Fo5176]